MALNLGFVIKIYDHHLLVPCLPSKVNGLQQEPIKNVYSLFSCKSTRSVTHTLCLNVCKWLTQVDHLEWGKPSNKNHSY